MRKKDGFLGIDLGSTGVRALAADEHGELLGIRAARIEHSVVPVTDERRSEQDPLAWERALGEVLEGLFSSLDGVRLRGVSVDSTSGTVIPVDAGGRPLHNAMLYNDVRAQEEAPEAARAAGMPMEPGFALPKILWLRRHRPGLFERVRVFLPAADFLKGLLTGEFDSTDFSNAVKMGYDLRAFRWPPEIETGLGIPLEKLPRVLKTGDTAGELRRELREAAGADGRVPVVAGATDSTTGFYASGVEKPGDWNTTLGTGLGFRGMAERFIPDPEGLVYAHRHPEGCWLPGAASNTGGEALRLFFGDRLEEYDRMIEGTPPTGGLVYPLVRRGEKLPFRNPRASGFVNAPLGTPGLLFKAFLEGLAYLERMTYEKIAGIGYPVGDRVFCMGGGAGSAPWLRIRAGVLGRRMCRARHADTSFGAAVIAAAGAHYGSLSAAVRRMVRCGRVIDPDPGQRGRYEELYGRFVEECRARGLF